ncbi:NUDIX hydrolase [Actinomyces oris]|uniref:NUDIX domain-containing protein n=1 Tax=Actinomyces oris TaxID=544580 RepID=UPI00094DE7E0|nr:NUDIX domain-containing protein [Actinomyces oris]OLO67645.1 NUDIX hydrolase [Actinomyces oris]
MAAHSFTLVPAAYVYLLRPDPSAADRGAGAASSETQVLLQLRRGTGYMDGHWACGASGHVEAAESVLETALREADEELGIGVDAEDLTALTAMHRTNDLGGAALEQRIDLFFTLRTWAGTPSVREPAKNAGLRWFSLAGLPEAVPPHERHVLELLATSLDGGRPVPPIITFGFDEGQDIARYGVALPH